MELFVDVDACIDIAVTTSRSELLLPLIFSLKVGSVVLSKEQQIAVVELLRHEIARSYQRLESMREAAMKIEEYNKSLSVIENNLQESMRLIIDLKEDEP